MRTLALCLVLLAPNAWAKKPAKPSVSPKAAVLAFYANVDALQLSMPHTEDVVGFTMDSHGAPLDAVGSAGWQTVQQILTQWGADGGTIASQVPSVSCWVEGELGGCAAQVHQEFTMKGEPAGGVDLRASFVFRWNGSGWAVAHWHEAVVATPEAEGTPEGGDPPGEPASE